MSIKVVGFWGGVAAPGAPLWEALLAQTGEDRIATAADRVQTGLDRIATGEDRIAVHADALAAVAAASLLDDATSGCLVLVEETDEYVSLRVGNAAIVAHG